MVNDSAAVDMSEVENSGSGTETNMSSVTIPSELPNVKVSMDVGIIVDWVTLVDAIVVESFFVDRKSTVLVNWVISIVVFNADGLLEWVKFVGIEIEDAFVTIDIPLDVAYPVVVGVGNLIGVLNLIVVDNVCKVLVVGNTVDDLCMVLVVVKIFDDA